MTQAELEKADLCWPPAGSRASLLALVHLFLCTSHATVFVKSICSSTGQLQNGDIRLSPDPSKGEEAAWMWRGTGKVLVTKVTKVLKDSSRRAHEALCWLVKRKDVEDLLGAPYSSYLASHLVEM